jgi:hypothetical protein
MPVMLEKRPGSPQPKRRPPRPRGPKPEQLVFPFELRLGDVILEDGVRAEITGPPESMKNGKTTRAWVHRHGDAVQREVVWEAWRKVQVVRKSAA